MDYDKTKRRQNLKVIVSEIIMFLIVVVTVVILAFIVSGYWINEKFEVERQGMLQIASQPTGADVLIDDETSWLQKTNTSKVLPVGEHVVSLTKEGYDSWSKTININEGLLYRLSYPRLFPIKREKTTMLDVIGTSKAFVSDNHEKLLLFSGDPISIDVSIYRDDSPSSTDQSTVLQDWKMLELKTRTPELKPVTTRNLYDFFKASEQKTHENVEDYNLSEVLLGTEELVFVKFYDDHYLAVINGSTVTLYKKGSPEPIIQQELSFLPTDIHPGKEGEFFVFSDHSKIATLDMELMTFKEWAVEGGSFDWLDDSMIYTVSEGDLIVYDYDGLNRRIIAKNVSERFPVIIVGDEWLYYFSNDNLIRENLKA